MKSILTKSIISFVKLAAIFIILTFFIMGDVRAERA
jgi:hypothetical protein